MKGWKTSVERNGQCSRGDSCGFRRGSDRGQRAQSSSPAPKAQTQIDGRKSSKGTGSRGESLSGRKGQKAGKHHLKGTCSNSSCNSWHPPVCQNCKSVSGCKLGDKCLFRHTEVDGQPSTKSKKSGGKGSVALLKESVQLGCVSQATHSPQKSILWKSGKFGSNRAVAFFARSYYKSVNLQNGLRVRKRFRTGRFGKPCNRNDAPAEKHGT